MHRRPGALVALLAFLSLVSAGSALGAPSADLAVSIDGRPDPVAAGQYVTYTVNVANAGVDAATNVVVSDPLPPKTSYIAGDSNCSLVGTTVQCAAATIPAGATQRFEIVLRLLDFSAHKPMNNTVTAAAAEPDPNTADNTATDVAHVLNNSHDHHVTVSKAEAQLDLNPGETKTVTLSCFDPADIMLDGSVRVDNVDQGTGTLRSVVVSETQALGNGYEFTATNTATGRAQTKVFGTCISKSTVDAAPPGQAHDVVVDPPLTSTATAVPAGPKTIDLSCPAPGQFAAAPGFKLSGGAVAELVSSRAIGEGTWRFTFDVTTPGDIAVSIRCLHRYMSNVTIGSMVHTHELWLSHIDKTFAIDPNAPAGQQGVALDCSDEAKGIVGGWDLESGLHNLGHDPQPKRREWKLLNDGVAPKSAHLYLLCVGDRTGTDPPPPAAAKSVAKTAAKTSGNTVRVVLGCPAGGCSGSLTIAGQTSTFGSRTATVTQKVKLTGRYRGAKRLTAVVRDWSGRVVRRAKVRVG